MRVITWVRSLLLAFTSANRKIANKEAGEQLPASLSSHKTTRYALDSRLFTWRSISKYLAHNPKPYLIRDFACVAVKLFTNNRFIGINNNTMLTAITEIYKQYPKHWVSQVSKNTQLVEWIATQTTNCDSSWGIKQKVLHLLHGPALCENGNIRHVIDFANGWRFCGTAKNCACAKKQISQKVSAAKNQYTDAERQRITLKRQQTFIENYGVTNAGQTAQARQAHAAFYSDLTKIAQQVQKQQTTLEQRYGVKNCRQLDWVNEKAAQTCQQRWGTANPMQNPQISGKSAKARSQNLDFEKLYRKKYQHFVAQLRTRWNVVADITREQYQGVADRPTMGFTCLSCGYQFEKRFDYAIPPTCKICNPRETTYLSQEEQQVADWIRENYTGVVLQSDRSIINPWQLDIVLPDKKLAVEYCGLYWHSEISSGKHWRYHANKADLCEQKGYRLVTIFSDEWLTKNSLVKQKILDIVGVNTQRIHARQCDVETIDYALAADFHNTWHIQGAPQRLGTNLALIHQGKTLAVASWVRKKDNNWELVRFSSAVRIPGGASKLLSAFVKKYNPTSIVSFSDRRWSQGNMYQRLGFVAESTVPPMQSYVENYSQRHHKLAFAKSKIVKEGEEITEWQRMQELGYDRIWDCGKLKWVWRK
jgi:rubrerythrin